MTERWGHDVSVYLLEMLLVNARDQISQLILIAVDEMQRVWQVSDMVPGLPKDQINRGFNLTNQQEFFFTVRSYLVSHSSCHAQMHNLTSLQRNKTPNAQHVHIMRNGICNKGAARKLGHSQLYARARPCLPSG
jgi:hypothetical protein